jgi:hypothetical protein
MDGWIVTTFNNLRRSAPPRFDAIQAGVTKVALSYSERFWGAQDSNMGLRSGPTRPAFQVQLLTV